MYNNPYRNSYQQYYPQYPQYPQPTQQPAPQQPTEQQIQGIRFLNAQQIQAYIPFANTKEVLVDMENELAYVVWADNMGISSKKSFSFKSLDEPKKEEKVQEIDLTQYVKVADLDKFVQKTDLQTILPIDSIKSLESKLQALESRLNGEKEHIETDSNAQ